MSTFHDRRQAHARATIDILPPEEARGKVIHFRKPVDVSDAHFETLQRDATRRRRAEATTARPAFHSHSNVHMAANDTRDEATAAGAWFKARAMSLVDGAERKLMKLSPDAFVAMLAAIIVAVFTACGGFSLIPDAGAADPGPAIDITHVTMTPQDANGMRVLLINGIVENRTDDHHAMPAIRAELIAGEQVVASTLITTEATRINGRQSYGFSARVPHPGGKLPDLKLSLAERGV